MEGNVNPAVMRINQNGHYSFQLLVMTSPFIGMLPVSLPLQHGSYKMVGPNRRQLL